MKKLYLGALEFLQLAVNGDITWETDSEGAITRIIPGAELELKYDGILVACEQYFELMNDIKYALIEK
jgi:hypothetical protein